MAYNSYHVRPESPTFPLMPPAQFIPPPSGYDDFAAGSHPRQDSIPRQPLTNDQWYDDRNPGIYRPPQHRNNGPPRSAIDPNVQTPPYTASTLSSDSSASIRSWGAASASTHGPPSTVAPIITNAGKVPPIIWDNVFHPSFLPSEKNFESEWHFTGLYTNHILFCQISRNAQNKRLLIYDVESQLANVIKIKYDSAGLGPNGQYLLYRQGDEMHLFEVASGRTLKSAHLRNLTRWAYNAIGFCIVDDSGKFWRWSFNDKLPPTLVFRLVDRAPRDRLRCITTQDGSWNAIVATTRDRKRGEVHCYPTDNDEARIFPGVLAAFTQSVIDDTTITHVAVVKIENENELHFSINQLGADHPGVTRRVGTTMSYDAVGGPPSAIFIDHDLAIAVVLTTPPTDTYNALFFDLRTGTYLLKQSITKLAEDSWLVDDTGIFRERKGSIVQRLKIIPEGLPAVRGPSGPPPPPILDDLRGPTRSPVAARVSPTSPYGHHAFAGRPQSPVVRRPSVPMISPTAEMHKMSLH